jgi:threonine synthase
MSYLIHLQCSKCGKLFSADEVQTVCTEDNKPLLSCYDLDRAAAAVKPEMISQRPPDMWRYREFLPVRDDRHIVSLSEGFSPLLRVNRLASAIGIENLWVKDESQLPTGSFKARGLSMAVSRALELGIKRVAIPSAGNAGAALAAYAARAGLEAYVFMPQDAPDANKAEVQIFGARGYLVNGLITDCAAMVREGKAMMNWFDMSTFKEPYRLEGKKTMGFEIAEQFGWELPDVIIYPTGGGTGLVGMWKAFQELKRIGWIAGRMPRMVCVQAEGCAPIVKAFHDSKTEAEPWKEASTVAAGIRVPGVLADFLILRILRESNGTAIAVSDSELLECVHILAKLEGVFASPEGAATVAALRHLVRADSIKKGERVVLFNTGSGLKYTDAFDVQLQTAERNLWETAPGRG